MTQADIDASLATYHFFDVYAKPPQAVTTAANGAHAASEARVAIGLANTLGVINMAFGGFIMKRVQLALETRAVTQNLRIATGMGTNPDRLNMMIFRLGFGSVGAAIWLFVKVRSEMSSYNSVQSFMTVIVGDVGGTWGTLAAGD